MEMSSSSSVWRKLESSADGLANLFPYLREFSDVVQLVDLGAERVEDCHVVGVLQQLLLQILEHSQRVAEQNLREGERGVAVGLLTYRITDGIYVHSFMSVW